MCLSSSQILLVDSSWQSADKLRVQSGKLALVSPVPSELLSVLLLTGYKSPTTQYLVMETHHGGLEVASGAGGCWDGVGEGLMLL